MTDAVLLERADHVAHLILNRPAALNAIDNTLASELLGVCHTIAGDPDIWAVVLRGAGETRLTFIANMVGHYAIGLPLSLVLGFGLKMGIVGIWWGLCAGLVFVALVLLWRFNRLSAGTLRPLEA